MIDVVILCQKQCIHIKKKHIGAKMFILLRIKSENQHVKFITQNYFCTV